MPNVKFDEDIVNVQYFDLDSPGLRCSPQTNFDQPDTFLTEAEAPSRSTRSNLRTSLFVLLLSALLLLSLVVYTVKSFSGVLTACDNQQPAVSKWHLQTPLITWPSPPPEGDSLLHCGNSTNEARSLGCVFQIWSNAWVPAPCYSATLDADFRLLQSGVMPETFDQSMAGWPAQTHGWSYFSDEEASNSIQFDTVAKGEIDVIYTTWLQHMWHCAFTWRKILMNLNGENISLTDRDLSKGHTGHCSEMVVNAGAWGLDTVNDMLVLGFLRCRV